jgi:hypothetical protein
MKIQEDQFIKVILKNNILLEGFVEEFSEKEICLRSSDGKSLFLILDTSQVILIKIILEPEKDIASHRIEGVEEKPRTTKQPAEQKIEIEKEFHKTYEQPSGDELRTKKLAELKIMLAEQEKKIISEKMRSHDIGEVTQSVYADPLSLLKKGKK